MPGRRRRQSVTLEGVRRVVAAMLVATSFGADGQAAPPAGVDELMAIGESALASGRSRDALEAFERAALLRHSALIEIGIVRALMQQGEYRRALAFAGHTAFAHADSPDGAALYALLLRFGGQAAVAQRLLDGAHRRAPADLAVERALALLSAPLSDSQVQALASMVPSGQSVPANAAVIGNATLLPDGQHAVTPSATLPQAGALWLRDGLGRTVRAERARADAASGLALLRLTDALPLSAPVAVAAREPFAGSPAFVVSFRTDARALSLWPQLSVGFLGMPATDDNWRWLGVDAARDSAGAPVFDAAGRLTGIVLPAQSDARLRASRAAALSAIMGPVVQAVRANDAASPPAGPDAIYERGLHCALQLIAVR